MLHDFLVANREEIVARARAKVAARSAPGQAAEEPNNGVPHFLSQLGETLRASQALRDGTAGDAPIQEGSHSRSGSWPPAGPSSQAIGARAAAHGADLLRQGFTVGQVVHDYGDVCQVVTELADETEAPITIDEFHILNRCLDDAIAGAVTEYTRQRERAISDKGTERLAALAHEMRNQLSAAMLAFEMLKGGTVGIGGSTGAVLARSLSGLRNLLARALAEARLDARFHNKERVSVAQLMEDIEVNASLEANTRGLELRVGRVEPAIDIEVDRQILAAAVANLLESAFKSSRSGGRVSLKTSATTDRVLIEIENESGPLPPGKAEDLLRLFEPLAVSRKGVEANGGVIRGRDVPGGGCVFSIELPRMAL